MELLIPFNGAVAMALLPLITPLESITKNISILLPGIESNAYKCIVKAFDDDKETALDTIYFRIILDKPKVTLHTKQASVKINAVVPVKATDRKSTRLNS